MKTEIKKTRKLSISYHHLTSMKILFHVPDVKALLCETLYERLHDLLQIKDQFTDLIICDGKHRPLLDDRALECLMTKSNLDREGYKQALEQAKKTIIPAIEELYRDETPLQIMERVIDRFLHDNCTSAQTMVFRHYYGILTPRLSMKHIAAAMNLTEEKVKDVLAQAILIVKQHVTGLHHDRCFSHDATDDDARQLFQEHKRPWSEKDTLYADMKRVQKSLNYLTITLYEMNPDGKGWESIADTKRKRSTKRVATMFARLNRSRKRAGSLKSKKNRV
jgi:hypothetical protein